MSFYKPDFNEHDNIFFLPTLLPSCHLQRIGIDHYAVIEDEFREEMALLTAFCLNKWQQREDTPLEPGAIQKFSSLEFWVENGTISELVYDKLDFKSLNLSRLIWAVAYDWMFIILIDNNYSVINIHPETILKHQLNAMIQMAEAKNLQGIQAYLTNPNLYEVFNQKGFKRDTNIDTGLPLPFSKKF